MQGIKEHQRAFFHIHDNRDRATAESLARRGLISIVDCGVVMVAVLNRLRRIGSVDYIADRSHHTKRNGKLRHCLWWRGEIIKFYTGRAAQDSTFFDDVSQAIDRRTTVHERAL